MRRKEKDRLRLPSLPCLSLFSFIVISLMFVGVGDARIDPATCVGMWLFDEGKDDTTEDSSKNGNDGELMNGPEWVDGKFGQALSFDGVSTFVNCGNGESIQLSDKITISGWVRNNGLGVRKFWAAKAAGGSDSDSEWWMEWTADNKASFTLWNSSSVRAVATGPNTLDGNWHFITSTYDKNAGSANLKIYVDGVLVGSTTQTGQLHTGANQPVIIGTIGLWPTKAFNGLIDEVAIFNVVLKEGDIQTLMNKGLSSITATVSSSGKLAASWGQIKK